MLGRLETPLVRVMSATHSGCDNLLNSRPEKRRLKDPNLIIDGLPEVQSGDVVSLGAPWDGGSSWLRGPAFAPARIRQELTSGARNLTSESGLDLRERRDFRLLGDLTLDLPEPHGDITRAAEQVLARGARPIFLGGDHSITYPLVRAVVHHVPHLTILHFDAHPDLYDELDGNRLSHACPMARIMEECPELRLIQLGIRTLNAHQQAQADRFGVEIHEMRCWQDSWEKSEPIRGPVYISIDLDALDPAFAPGVSHPEPGGMTVRQLLEVLAQLSAPIVGADIVELNPVVDVRDVTAVVAAKILKELVAQMLGQSSQ